MPPFPSQDGEEDLLYISPYANKHEEETWSPEHLDHLTDGENGSRIMSPFHTSSDGPPTRKPWTWSFSFVFRGRRRRVTLRAPRVSLDALKDLVAFLGDEVGGDVKFRRRGLMRSTVMDFASVLWVFVVIWTVMAWWSL